MTITLRERLAVELNRRLVAAEQAERDAAAELESVTDPSAIPDAFRAAAIARDYAAECRSAVEQIKGVAL